jgi:hypothetical protein
VHGVFKEPGEAKEAEPVGAGSGGGTTTTTADE